MRKRSIKAAPADDRCVVFSKVDACFELRNQRDQSLFERPNSPRKCAAQLLRGGLGLQQGLRVDQVADGFRLGQVDAAGKEGALGKLAGRGQARAVGEQQAQQVVQQHG